MADLFGNEKEVIRTLGFYQPFGSLMLHGKIETRWCRVGRKPSFPLGKYLFYTTQKKCGNGVLFDWCGAEIMSNIIQTLSGELTKFLFGYALCYGTLFSIRPMRLEDEKKCFVKYKGIILRKDKNGVEHEYQQQCLFFENIERIEPYKFLEGKQGVGILK